MVFTPVVMVLLAISKVGALAAKKLPLSKLALCACIPLAIIVIVGNSLAPPHVEIMRTFSKPLNALLLVVGGYILQAALIGTTILQLARARIAIVQKQKN